MSDFFENWPVKARQLASCLVAGDTVQFRPVGNSMQPRIESGQLVTVEPLDVMPEVGDIVFCQVNGSFYVHLVKDSRRETVLIGNNKGRINGWTPREFVFGRVVKVED